MVIIHLNQKIYEPHDSQRLYMPNYTHDIHTHIQYIQNVTETNFLFELNHV